MNETRSHTPYRPAARAVRILKTTALTTYPRDLNMRTFLLPVILLFVIHTTARADGNVPAGLDAPTVAFFQKHCVRCHGAKTAEGDLRLD